MLDGAADVGEAETVLEALLLTAGGFEDRLMLEDVCVDELTIGAADDKELTTEAAEVKGLRTEAAEDEELKAEATEDEELRTEAAEDKELTTEAAVDEEMVPGVEEVEGFTLPTDEMDEVVPEPDPEVGGG